MTRRSPQRAFSLVELLIGASLGGVVMTAMLSAVVFVGRNLSRLASYQALENESRKALAYLRADLAVAKAVKSGTTPTASTVTLVLPGGEVTYTYSSATQSLRRQANFGANHDFSLLQNGLCACTAFEFDYYTLTDAAPTDQSNATTYVPYSIKQIQAKFTVASPTTWSILTRTRLQAATSRFLIRNRGETDGN